MEVKAKYNFRPTRLELEPKVLTSLSVRPTLSGRIGASQSYDTKLAEILNHLEFVAESEDLKSYEVDREGWLRVMILTFPSLNDDNKCPEGIFMSSFKGEKD